MQLIENSDIRPIPFFLVSSSDGSTGAAGTTPSVWISQDGGAFVVPAGATVEIGYGWYSLIPSAADTGVNGAFLLHATAAGADTTDLKCQIVPQVYTANAAVQDIVNGVWDEPGGNHAVTGSMGVELAQAASSAGTPWTRIY